MISKGASSDDRSGADLLRRLRAGDEEAWAMLFATVRTRLSEIAAAELPSELASRVDASDVVQQTFAEAHRSLATFRGESFPEIVCWLVGIAKHNSRDAVRAHRTTEKRSVLQEACIDGSSSGGGWRSVLAADQTSPTGAVARLEDIQRLNAALGRLPPRQRDAVRMRHLEGRALADIAAALDCSKDAAAQLIARGLKTIRDSLGGGG